VDRWWALGDLVLFGPRPVDVLELLLGLPGIGMVRGNTDRYVLTGEQPAPHATAADAAGNIGLVERYAAMAAGIAWTRGVLDQADLLDVLTGSPGAPRCDRAHDTLRPLTGPIGCGARIAASVARTATRAPAAAARACGCTTPGRLAAGSYQSSRPGSGGSDGPMALRILRGRDGVSGLWLSASRSWLAPSQEFRKLRCSSCPPTGPCMSAVRVTPITGTA